MNYLNKFKLDNKISLVTGGAGGIGIEICKSLLDAGSKVIIADINNKKSKKLLKKIKNKNIEYYKLDSTSEKNIKSLSRFILKKYKRLDVLVNCIGICFNKEAEKVKKKEWDKVINININSMFYVCKEFGKIFIKQKKGNLNLKPVIIPVKPLYINLLNHLHVNGQNTILGLMLSLLVMLQQK